jgi:uncharacterized membrane protein
VNNRGEIVGYGFASTGRIRSLRWTEQGGVVELPTCVGTHTSSAALGTNEQGLVAGYCTGAAARAFVWSAATGTTLLPEGVGAVRSLARAVNDRGWVVGSVTDATQTYAAAWVPDGGGYELRRLQLPEGYSATSGIAVQINADGIIVGTADGRGIRWDDPSLPGELLPLPAGAARSAANGINRRGVIVGTATDAAGTSAQATRWAR